jgi:hypothetical protein
VHGRRENQRTILLADCTLRDGSRQNNFGFTKQDTAILSTRPAGFPKIGIARGVKNPKLQAAQ